MNGAGLSIWQQKIHPVPNSDREKTYTLTMEHRATPRQINFTC